MIHHIGIFWRIAIFVELLAIHFHDTVSRLWPVVASKDYLHTLTQAGARGLAFIRFHLR